MLESIPFYKNDCYRLKKDTVQLEMGTLSRLARKLSLYPLSSLSLSASRADNSYYQKVSFYLTPDLLILDELGFKKLPGYSADDFFEVISKRYEKGSLIITTNKAFEQWGDIFADNILA